MHWKIFFGKHNKGKIFWVLNSSFISNNEIFKRFSSSHKSIAAEISIKIDHIRYVAMKKFSAQSQLHSCRGKSASYDIWNSWIVWVNVNHVSEIVFSINVLLLSKEQLLGRLRVQGPFIMFRLKRLFSIIFTYILIS